MANAYQPRLSDEELMLRHENGDRSAFEELVVRHLPRMVNVVRQKLRGMLAQQAEDLVHEAWIRVLGSLEQNGVPPHLVKLAYLVLDQRIVDLVRKNKRSRETVAWDEAPVSVFLSTSEDHATGIGEADAFTFDQALVRKALAMLKRSNAEEHEAVRLTYVEGLPLREAALRMGKSIATVHRRVRDGLLSLASILRDITPPRETGARRS